MENSRSTGLSVCAGEVFDKMPRRSLNGDGGKKGRVRKRGSSSPSSSSLMQNYRLKRALLVGKKGGSSTPAPMWKMMSSESPSIEDNETRKCVTWRNSDNVEELSVSARKLAAILWEINGVPSPRPRNILEDRNSEVGSILESSKLGSIGKHHVSKVGLSLFVSISTNSDGLS